MSLHADIMLISLPGAVGFLRDDLRAVPSVSNVRAGADHLIARVDGPIGALASLQTYASLGLLLPSPASHHQPDQVVIPHKLRTLEDQLLALAATDPPLRYRVDASVPERRRMIESIHRELGWENDPSHWHVNLTVHADRLVVQVGAAFITERLGALARIPASTTPIIAEVMVRLAKVRSGHTVLDCFCGAGTILVTAGARVEADQLNLVGLDWNQPALAVAQQNLQRRGVSARLARADARHLPLPDQSVDRIVSNLPFGKRVGSHRANEVLYPSFLREAERVLAPGGRAVLLSEDKALLRQTVQRTHRIKIIREVLLRSGGGTPTAFVVERNRAPRRRRRG